MKRKIALALAAVMTIVSAIPMNLFAATETTATVIANSNYSYNDDKGMFSAGGNQTSLPAGTTVTDKLNGLFNDGRGFQDRTLINNAKGTNLIVRFTDYATEGYFQIQLDGAEFGYAYAENGVYTGRSETTTFGEWFRYRDYKTFVGNTAVDDETKRVDKVTTGRYGIDVKKIAVQDVTVQRVSTIANTTTPDVPATIAAAVLTAVTAMGGTGSANTETVSTVIGSGTNQVANVAAMKAKLANLLANSATLTGFTQAGVALNADAVVSPLFSTVQNVTSNQLTVAEVEAMYLAILNLDNTIVGTTPFSAVQNLINNSFVSLATTIATPTAASAADVNAYVAVAGALGYTDLVTAARLTTDPVNTNLLDYNTQAQITANNITTTATPIDYEMQIDPNNRHYAQIHFKGTVTPFDYMVIPMPYNNETDGQITAKVIGAGGYGNVSPKDVVIATQGGTGVKIIPGEVATGNYRIYLNDIRFEEKTIGTIKNGEVTFRAKVKDRSQYYFPAAYNNKDTIKVTSFIGITGEARVTDVIVREDLGTITLKIDGMTPSVGTLGTLVVKNLVVAPVNPEEAPYDGEVKLEILPHDKIVYETNPDKKFANTVNLPARLEGDAFVVAKRAIWEVGVTSEDNKTIYAGRENQYIGKVIVNEGTSNSWWSEKETTFTLTNAEGEAVEGAKISGVKIWTENTTPSIWDRYRSVEDGNNANIIWSKDLASVTLVDLVASQGKRGRITLAFDVSMDPNFPAADGTDLYVTVNKGRELFAQSYTGDVNTVKIGTVIPTTLIEVGETKVQIGYQSLSVANITLTEKQKGAWEKGNVELSIGEYGTGEISPYMYFGAVAKGNVAVANPDKTQLTISTVKSGTKAGNPLSFSVDRKSDYVGAAKKSEPAEISLKDIVLNISREVPEGSFDLIVGGSALVNNYRTTVADLKGDKFEAAGYVAEGAIQVTTVGSNKPFTKRVDVYYAEGAPAEGGSKVVVDGVTTDMEFGAYLDTEVNRVMVPVRFISYVLGVEEENTFWNAKDGTFSIFTPERTVVFKQNSNILTVNGLTSTMMNADGTEITPIIRADNQKLYLPFAFVGQAFGIGVNSDNQADGFVSYNYDTTTEVVAE